ncbi:hypothetical protein [Paraoerskovia sediminicola]|uniref:hypothetical protein n=1 Tax=Paraoerskovia sediminicola TaxID=1138587 RepID=UPI00257388FD|nr:hypothetical protein [Paraoerskovia sediminicola]
MNENARDGSASGPQPAEQLGGAAYWAAATITVLSALISLGYSVAGVLGDGASEDFALYAASRSIGLAVAALLVLTSRSLRVLLVVGATMTVVQVFDGFIGLSIGDTVKTVGPFALAALTAVALMVAYRAHQARTVTR